MKTVINNSHGSTTQNEKFFDTQRPMSPFEKRKLDRANQVLDENKEFILDLIEKYSKGKLSDES